jgi:hypothetical protein
MPDEAAAATTTTQARDGQAAGQTTATTATAAPSAFDWKASGIDDAGLNLVTDRQWKSPADLLKSYSNLEKLTGVPPDKLIKIPKDNDPNAWNEVYTKLGRPASADKYVIPVPDGQPKDFANEFGEQAFKAGLPQSAVTHITEWFNAKQAAAEKAQAEQLAQKNTIEINDLKKTWGPDYDKNAEVVDRAAETFGMTQDHLSAFKQVLGPKAAMELMHKIGSKIAVEGQQDPAGMGGKGEFTLSPESAKARIAQLKADPSFSQLFTSKDPKQRMEARAEMDRLHQLAYPGVTDFAGASMRTA